MKISIKVLMLSVLIVAAINSFGQTSKPKTNLLKGVDKVVSGEPLEYHCFNSAATSAILTRCTDGNMIIEWETEAIPMNTTEKFVTFYWICAYSSGTSHGDRNFFVSVNDEKHFTFKTYKDKIEKHWEQKAEDGSELSFDYKGEDGLNDVSGFMYLKVPLSKYRKGESVKLKVVGEKADSRDWYMIFQYAMNNSFIAYQMPFLLNTNGKTSQVIRADISYPKETGKASIVIDGNSKLYNLTLGLNTFEIEIPAFESAKNIPIDVIVNDEKLTSQMIPIKPVNIKSIYLMPHSHNDIGYSDIQPDVMKKQLKNINDALELIKKTENYPLEARFKWNIEVLWATETFMKTATDVKKKEFIDAVKKGAMGLQAMYTNPLTGISRPEEFYKLTEYSRELSKDYGVTINSAMISDVPGMTWNTIPTLVQSGVKYFSSGPNYMIGFKMKGEDGIGSGDRVGYSSLAWGDKPFYWISPSGKEKMLYWMAGLGYSAFHSGSITRNTLRFKKTLTDYLNYLERTGFPYDIIQMRYTIKGDNGPVDPELSDFVKAWNEKYISPKIIISTSEQAFIDFEKKYAKTLPSFSGDMTPYWEDGAVSTAYETGLVRNVSENLVQSEILFSLLNPKKYNAGKFFEAWKNVLLWDEHTWGAYNSTSDPDCEFATTQWKIKQAYALDVDKQAKELRNDILVNQTNANFIDVINTNSWKRTDLVVISKEMSAIGDVVLNDKGKVVPSQRLSTGELAFLAEDVPALASSRYQITGGKSAFNSSLSIENNIIKDDDLQIEIDALTGCINHIKYKNITELVDKKDGGLNKFYYVEGYDANKSSTNGIPAISIKEKGPLVSSFIIESEAPGCNSLFREIRMVHGLNKIDIINAIDKKLIRKGEAIHFGYPFNVPNSTVRIDLGFAVIRPELDQLNGACKDFYSAQRWVDVSNDSYGVTFTLNETPLIEIGEMHSELPDPGGIQANSGWKKVQKPSSTLFTYVMNNYWFTNYKADQPGLSKYTHSIVPHAAYQPEMANRYGIEASQPLIVQQVNKGQAGIVAPFTLNNSKVMVTYIKPTDDGKGLLVRLYNPGNTTEEVTLALSAAFKSVYKSNPKEETGEKIDKLQMVPNEIISLIVAY